MSGYYRDEHRYDDIIDMPHHRSTERAHMSLYDRAAQFSPFAALTGHEEAIEETARLTEKQVILEENAIEKINRELYEIAQHPDERRSVSITYFRPDPYKEGGVYLTEVGVIRKLDEVEKVVIMESGLRIPMEHILGTGLLSQPAPIGS